MSFRHIFYLLYAIRLGLLNTLNQCDGKIIEEEHHGRQKRFEQVEVDPRGSSILEVENIGARKKKCLML